MSQPFQLKDSGERREFDTGAKRDVDYNKPRFDLIPMTVLRALLARSNDYITLNVPDDNIDNIKAMMMEIGFSWGDKLDYDSLYDLMWLCLRLIQHSESKETLLDVNPDMYSGFNKISMSTYERLAQLYGNGAKKYDPWNWTKGMSLSVFHASLMRHIFKFIANEADEDHLSAIFFNAAALVHFYIMDRHELDDITPRFQDWEDKRIMFQQRKKIAKL